MGCMLCTAECRGVLGVGLALPNVIILGCPCRRCKFPMCVGGRCLGERHMLWGMGGYFSMLARTWSRHMTFAATS